MTDTAGFQAGFQHGPHALGATARGSRPIHLTALDSAAADGLAAAFAAISPWADYPYPAAGLARYFSGIEPGAPRFAITIGGEAGGVVGLRLNWLRGPYLQFLGVLPALQGAGIGARVLDWMEREARTQGDRNLWVAASDFNHAALRFYARHGFRETARLDGLVMDGRTEVLMRKLLR